MAHSMDMGDMSGMDMPMLSNPSTFLSIPTASISSVPLSFLLSSSTAAEATSSVLMNTPSQSAKPILVSITLSVLTSSVDAMPSDMPVDMPTTGYHHDHNMPMDMSMEMPTSSVRPAALAASQTPVAIHRHSHNMEDMAMDTAASSSPEPKMPMTDPSGHSMSDWDMKMDMSHHNHNMAVESSVNSMQDMPMQMSSTGSKITMDHNGHSHNMAVSSPNMSSDMPMDMNKHNHNMPVSAPAMANSNMPMDMNSHSHNMASSSPAMNSNMPMDMSSHNHNMPASSSTMGSDMPMDMSSHNGNMPASSSSMNMDMPMGGSSTASASAPAMGMTMPMQSGSSNPMVGNNMAMPTPSSAAPMSMAPGSSSDMPMSMDMSSHMAGSCRVSMFWNWFTLDACFITEEWHITSKFMFALTCVFVISLVVFIEFLRRLGIQYDARIRRAHQFNGEGEETAFKPSVLQQMIRSFIHVVVVAAGYLVMLLVMDYNGFIILCVVIGAYLGFFIFAREDVESVNMIKKEENAV